PCDTDAPLFSSGVSGRTATPRRPCNCAGASALFDATFASDNEPMVTFRSFLALSRHTCTVAELPGARPATCAGRADESATGSPFTDRITSPGCKPALAAGPAG